MISKACPTSPIAGQIYFLRGQTREEILKLLREDGLKWDYQGRHALPSKMKPIVVKTYQQNKNLNLCRLSFALPDEKIHGIVVQYIEYAATKRVKMGMDSPSNNSLATLPNELAANGTADVTTKVIPTVIVEVGWIVYCLLLSTKLHLRKQWACVIDVTTAIASLSALCTFEY